ncbi:MAG: hypothetical protein HY922_11175, partial [Elusimicrobia bacterium]|nr:hypothetical protein [Elusimicrobiota bacterium]
MRTASVQRRAVMSGPHGEAARALGAGENRKRAKEETRFRGTASLRRAVADREGLAAEGGRCGAAGFKEKRAQGENVLGCDAVGRSPGGSFGDLGGVSFGESRDKVGFSSISDKTVFQNARGSRRNDVSASVHSQASPDKGSFPVGVSSEKGRQFYGCERLSLENERNVSSVEDGEGLRRET